MTGNKEVVFIATGAIETLPPGVRGVSLGVYAGRGAVC
jgi:hypothetical protein